MKNLKYTLMIKINVLLLIFIFSVLLSSKVFSLEAKDLYKKVSPAVVEVVIYERENGNIKILESGSGFFIGPQYVVTNYHVIEDAMNEGTFAAVSWNKKYFFKITVAVYDKDLDIAILGINITDHKNYLKRGDSGKVEVGEKVYVIGAPLGLEKSLSEGIISGIRKKDDWKKYFQISNPVSPGSSGSPVVNNKGEYIGIVVGSLEEGQNLNFAVSSGYIKYLVANGEFTDTSIGIIENEYAESQPKTHTIQSKETLYYIAKKYNVTVEDIVKLNKIKGPPYIIHPGDVLQIPETKK